ncbi:hypothetical protein Ae706Ps2_6712c [Pseudonocardia sp. Ae706_Ps2]|nr:hypothetical protein Ae706Ps2_6712c [Pseudonocardia sp. Ae706_Ps2]
MSRMAWAACGKNSPPRSGHRCRESTLIVRVSTRPWPRARCRAAGPVIFQGSARSRASSVGWLALTVIR